MMEKHKSPHELILDGLKWERFCLEKWQGIDVTMHEIRQKTVKAFELEDQYAVISGLALWPEEPREINFFQKSWCSQKISSRNDNKLSKRS